MGLHVRVVSPERVLWTGDAEMVTARTVEGGDVSFLAGHTPFLGALETGKVVVRPNEGPDTAFAVHGGFVEVSHDEVTVLSDGAEHPDDIDVERAKAALAAARTVLASEPGDVEALAARRRAELRLELAGIVPD